MARTGSYAKWLWLFLLATWFTCVVVGTEYAGDSLDMREFLNNPVRMLRGELPYRDFWLLMPPGAVLLPAALYRIGFDVDGLLGAMGAISVASGLLAFVVARALFHSNLLAALCASLFFFNGLTFHHQSYLYIHAYLPAALLGVFLLHRYWVHERGVDLFLAGVAFGLGICFRFYYGGGALAAGCLVLLVRGHRSETDRADLLRCCATFAAGVLIFPVLASLFLHDVWGPMVHNVVVDSLIHGTVRSSGFWHEYGDALVELAAYLRALPDFAIRDLLGEISSTTAQLMIRTLPLVLVACIALWLKLVKPRDRLLSPATATLMVLLVWGALVFMRGYVRGAVPKLSHAATPWFFILVFFFYEFRRLAPSIWTRVAIIVLSVVFLGFAQQWVRVSGQSAALLANPSQRVTAPFGTLAIQDEESAYVTRSLIQHVVENTDEEDYIFITSGPPLYALTRRRNPTYYDSLIDLVYRPSVEHQQAVCNDLAIRTPALIIYRIGWDLGDATLQFDANCPILKACILERFQLVETVGRYRVLRPPRWSP